MKAVLQRVQHASVKVDEQVIGQISQGFLILLGICHQDTQEDINYLVKKISQMRIFEDQNGKMNLSLKDIEGQVLIISQFTLFASTKKGNRPGFTDSAPPSLAIPLYEKFIEDFKSTAIPVQTGEFGADMKLELLNDGPVTIIVDSQDR